MNLDIVIGFGGWTQMFIGALAFVVIGLLVDVARERALREMRSKPGATSAPIEAEPPA
ncbi:MAG TPA: hypothetical protein VGQ02_09425 [Candidatus Limnocylindrales bacterium]|nr:hypothetical protein [Candidatus Limnocylindrales bacterium]